MQDRLFEALRACSVDYCDIRIEDKEETAIVFQGEELDEIGSSRTVGGIVRALHKGGWGYATFNELEGLEMRVEQACESARLVGKETSELAEVEPVVDVMQANLENDFRQIPLAQKKDTIEEYNRIVLGFSPKIQTSTVAYGDYFKKVWFASSEGTYIADEEPDCYVAAIATGREGNIVQNGREVRNSRGFEAAEGFHDSARVAAQRAVDLLSAPVVKGGQYTTVLDPRLNGVFVHEAFGHLSESDFVYETPAMRELMQLGKRFGPDTLNVLDDGTVPNMFGSHKYDHEGTPMRKNYLIKDGILVGRLHSRETAAKMGEPVSGNARAVAYYHPPIVRMTNTYIDKGDATFDEMIADIDLGVYALSAFGGQTALEMFTFSAGWGYMIRDGQIAEMVRDVVLTGNVFETLQNVSMLENKMQWGPGSGPYGCGKSGQAWLKVGLGGPHVRIENVTIGGQQ